jgi:hypothetical protein
LFEIALMELRPPHPQLSMDQSELSAMIDKLKQNLRSLQQPRGMEGRPFDDLDHRITALRDELDAVHASGDLEIEKRQERASRDIESAIFRTGGNGPTDLDWSITSLHNAIETQRQRMILQSAQWETQLTTNQTRLDLLFQKEEQEQQTDAETHKIHAAMTVRETNSILEQRTDSAAKARGRCELAREEEAIAIADFEQKLRFKTEYLGELMRTFHECKRKIVLQESSYNVRFGISPCIAVLRPGSAMSVTVRRPGKKPTRPVTASAVIGQFVGVDRRQDSLLWQRV